MSDALRQTFREALIIEARSLAEYIATGPMRTQPTLARVAVVLDHLADSLETAPPAGAAPVPSALTVERLAALLDQADNEFGDEHTPYVLAPQELAAWLLPRLGAGPNEKVT